jgi:hypothetical protein
MSEHRQNEPQMDIVTTDVTTGGTTVPMDGELGFESGAVPSDELLVRPELPANQVSTKRGFPVYRTNPSVPSPGGMPSRTRRFQVPGGKAAMIVDPSSGEIKGIGGMGFWWEEEVETSRFVKLFLDGIKQAAGLSKTGMQVFELVYHEMRANPGSDEIKLNQYVAKDHGMSDRSYQRGVRELLEKEFLFRSPSDGVFFVNIRFMFNGDRLAFVKSYHLKGSDREPRRASYTSISKEVSRPSQSDTLPLPFPPSDG